MSYTKGYKAFDRIEGEHKKGSCRNLIYSEGQVLEMDEKPVLCKVGYHFCKDLVLTSAYYTLDLEKTIYADQLFSEIHS